MEILHRDDLTLGGFAGLKEHRLVIDPKITLSGEHPGVWPGLGNWVYLADARFNPGAETKMHPHHEIDVISMMIEGRIAHEGSLEHGTDVVTDQVQVQRAGGEGFSHNEINPDGVKNRMLQLWVLPEEAGQPAGYKLYDLAPGGVVRIYGGPAGQDATFASQTTIDVALPEAGQSLTFDGPFIAYLSRGSGSANGQPVEDGDIFRGEGLSFEAAEPGHLLVVQLAA